MWWIKWKVLRKCHAYNQKKRQYVLCLNEKYQTACYKGDKSVEPVDTEVYMNLKIVTQKTDVIYQSYNVVKNNIDFVIFYYEIYLAEDW